MAPSLSYHVLDIGSGSGADSCSYSNAPFLIPSHNAINPCFFEALIWLNSLILFGPGLYQLGCLLLTRIKVSYYGDKDDDQRVWDSFAVKKLSKISGYRLLCLLMLGLTFASRWDLYFFKWNSIAVLTVGLPLAYVECFSSFVASGSLLFYFLFQGSCLFFATVQSTVNNGSNYPVAGGSAVLDFGFAGCLVCLVLFSTMYQPTHAVTVAGLKSGITHANILSQITFSWMTELLDKGYRNSQITEADIPTPPAMLDTRVNYEQLRSQWETQKAGRRSLLFALVKVFGATIAISMAYELVDDMLSFVQPQIIKYLLRFFNSRETLQDQPLKGYLLASGLFATSVLSTALYNKIFTLNYTTSLNAKSGLMTLTYHKALRLSPEARKERSTGDIVNLLSVDTSRVQDLGSQFQVLVSAPIKLVLCVISLYSLLGNATFSGLLVMAVMIPINTVISRKMKLTFKTQMKYKDQRTRVTNEILANIKSIKLYAIEKPMLERLSHVRNDLELKNLGRIGVFSALMNFMWSSVPFLVTCSTFLTFALTNKQTPLTPEIVFPALALFDLLSEPIYAIPSVITSLIEVGVAFQRINSFLNAQEIEDSAVTKLPPCEQRGDIAVSVDNAQFLWESVKTKYVDEEQCIESLKSALTVDTFKAKKGELSCIVGKVGAGKSTFLQSILGYLPTVAIDPSKPTNITHHGSIAYCSQIPWIMNATVRDNILFGHKFDPEFYQKTLQACQLLPDLEILPDGDETHVGEKGISLSGGQKARLSLARAVYARADIYLLDDVLSAVDSHVAKGIVDQVILGLLSGKCIVLATNSINVLKHASEIILLEQVGGGACIVERGQFNDVRGKTQSKLGKLIEEFGTTEQADEEEEEETVERQNINNPTPSITSHRRASVDSFKKITISAAERSKPSNERKTAQEDEKASVGKVNFKVYKRYAQACGVWSVAAFITLMICATAFSLIANYVLKDWSEDNSRGGANRSISKYIGLYTLFGLGGSLFTLGRTIFMWLVCSIRASRVLHDDMALAVLRSPMSYFETTPIGRILNRFTSDINKIDEAIPRVFAGFFGSIIRTILILGFIAFNMPLFLFVILIVSSLYVGYQRYYVATSRDLKRIAGISRSPILQHVQESLAGVDTVLAYQQKPRFHFLNFSNLDFNIRTLYILRSLNRWLSLRLQFLGSVIIFSAATLAITNQLGAGMAGLIITYALRVTSSLNWIVRMTVEVETNLVSIERVLDYTELKPEADEHTDIDISTQQVWPSDGAVKMKHYSTRYRENLDLVLNDINLDIKAGEKVGIVGRTGAGKSSLALAIFRMIEPVEGHIEIDNINTSKLGLTDLRSNLAIIPQDSQAFAGTVRSNLDPLEKYTDERLWWALELAHLKEFVEGLGTANAEVGLYAQLSEGGSNISVGQRQLLCLAKALLNESKVLILDEATASVDFQTDKIIQETIRREFQNRTILTIAHRLDTIMDSDKVVVLDKGRVVQYDSVEKLLSDEKGEFYGLCAQSGMFGNK
ncbi:hypothetical protein WICPIJ_001574 [Wickerhamomyces pijperi]|uniref:Uncharacterized protein n=1 Tax=Wickerhamomyces pijperi TaxID=599730 RepID=A0A9P8QDE2_WICPI|nr:hypothetical protein WICPIJ_001574 [Wickerhamomyces pijperi]